MSVTGLCWYCHSDSLGASSVPLTCDLFPMLNFNLVLILSGFF